MKRSPLKMAVWLLSTAAFLSGCASLPPSPTPSRHAMQDFSLEGRFALNLTRADGEIERSSGRLRWTHENGRDRILLASPLGTGLAEIDARAGHAELRTSDDKVYVADDAETLLAEVSGQPLPIRRLPAWLVGRTHGGELPDTDAAGRPIRLQESGWQIEYSYDHPAADALPGRLTLRRPPDIELRLRIESWTPLP